MGRSPGQDTLENIFLDIRACLQRYPPIKNTRTFITWKGSPRNYRLASKKTKSNFRSPSIRTTDTGTDKSNRKFPKSFLHGARKTKKKNLNMISVKTNCLSEF